MICDRCDRPDLVTDAAVKAAERAIVYEAGGVEYTPVGRIVEANPEDLACAAVRAAAPHILAAELETGAARQDLIAKEFGERAAGFEGPKEFIEGYLAAVEDFAVGLRRRAAELRGQSDD